MVVVDFISWHGGHVFFFFQAEDGIRDAQESRGLGDVYKRQTLPRGVTLVDPARQLPPCLLGDAVFGIGQEQVGHCLLYTSDAADDLLCVDLGGRRIIKKKKHHSSTQYRLSTQTNIQKRSDKSCT